MSTGPDGSAGSAAVARLRAAASGDADRLPVPALGVTTVVTALGLVAVFLGLGLVGAGAAAAFAGLCLAGVTTALADDGAASGRARRPRGTAGGANGGARGPEARAGVDARLARAGGAVRSARADEAARPASTEAARARRDARERTAAGAGLVLAGAALVAAFGLAFEASASTGESALYALAVSGAALAAFGATCPVGAPSDPIDRSAVASAVAVGALFAFATLLGVAWIVGEVGGGGGALAWLLDVLAWRGQPAGGGPPGQAFEYALATLLLVVTVALYTVAYATSRLDVARLAPRSERARIRGRLDALARRCRRRGRLAGLGFLGALAVAVLPLPIPYGSVPGLTSAATLLVGSTVLRWPLVAGTAALWVALVGTKLLLVVAHLLDAERWTWLPVALGAAGCWAALPLLAWLLGDPVIQPALGRAGVAGTQVPVLSTDLSTFVREIGTLEAAGWLAAVLALATLVPALCYAALAIGRVANLYGGPASGGAVAGAGLVAGSLAAGGTGATPIAVVVPVAAGLVVWDAAEHGAGLAAETGSSSDAYAPTFVHAAATAGVAVLALAIGLGTATLVGGAIRPDVRVPAVLALLAALVVLLVVLRTLAAGESGREITLTWPSGALRAHPVASSLVGAVLLAAVLGRGVGFGPVFVLVVSGVAFVVGTWALHPPREPEGPEDEPVEGERATEDVDGTVGDAGEGSGGAADAGSGDAADADEPVSGDTADSRDATQSGDAPQSPHDVKPDDEPTSEEESEPDEPGPGEPKPDEPGPGEPKPDEPGPGEPKPGDGPAAGDGPESEPASDSDDESTTGGWTFVDDPESGDGSPAGDDRAP